MVQGWSKQWKSGCGDRSDEGIDGDGTVGVEAVAIDDVAHALPEGDEAAHADECCGDDLRDPSHVWI